MKMMLDWQNISRQGAHQGIARMHDHHRDLLQTMELASQVRADHPQMGCRDIYYTLPDQMPRGRNWTERVLLSCGYRVKKPLRSFTEPGTNICSNLIEGMKVTAPNQVWQTDITFKWSHCLSKALADQSGQDLKGLIIHTDRGVQYTCNEYRTYLKDNHLLQSMAQFAWQNAYCERVNRTIKNNYLKYYRTDTYRALCRSVSDIFPSGATIKVVAGSICQRTSSGKLF